MLNRSQIQSCITCVFILGTIIISSSGHPAQRRTLTLVDRLMRANPLRNLAKYFGQRFSMDLYYPPPPMQMQQQPRPSAHQTHYVKVPMWQPIYYSPTVAMIAPPMMQQKNPQVLHGLSYPQAMIQPALSAYKPVMSEPVPLNPAHYLAPPVSNQVSQNGNGLVLNNGNMYPNENELYNGDDSNTAGNMVRIIVIQPTDLDKMKSLPESEFMNGYTMKYIELDDNTDSSPQDSLPFQTQEDTRHQHSRTRPSMNQTFVEPLCDPFLRKLIPELLPSSTIAQVVFQSQENKNNNQTLRSTRDNSEYIDNYQEESSSEEDEITMVKAFEDSNLAPQIPPTNPPPTTHSHHKKPLSARINSTFLRKYEPKTSQLTTLPMTQYSHEKVHQNVHKLTHNHLVTKANTLSSSESELIPSETSVHFESSPNYPLSQSFQSETSSYPHRYGTNGGKQRMFHYSGGVVFNKSKM